MSMTNSIRWKIANWLLKGELKLRLYDIRRSAEKSLVLPNRQTPERKNESFNYIIEQVKLIYDAAGIGEKK